MASETAILGIFADGDDLVGALARLKEEGRSVRTIFSPIPIPEVQEIMGRRPSPVRLVVLLGAIFGALTLVGLAVYAHLSYRLITSGKPVLPWIAWVVVCFEGLILGGVVSGALAWALMGRLPRLGHPEGYDGAFAKDRFGILVECTEGEEETVRRRLDEAGAEEVRRVS